MIRFECDYTEGVHPRILDAIVRTNDVQTPGYGEDKYCETARKMIQIACGSEEMEVQFLVGGTQANATIIASALRPYQAVLAAETAHIARLETGAVEATGHKVLTLPTQNGKITALQIKQALETHWNNSYHVHITQPAMVYISQPTETGLVYSRREIQEISRVCRQEGIYFFIDGARIGYALGARCNDAFLADIAELCDVFYIGATKVGAMFGEAVCIPNRDLQRDFRYNIKQRGGMLAKGRFLGIQFETLFRDGLYLEISKKAVDQAMKIKRAFEHEGCEFLFDSPTNQQFPIVNSLVYNEITRKYCVSLWDKLDGDHFAIKIVTSWATKDETVEELIEDVKRIFSLYNTKPAVDTKEFFG
jgi:threonine aldolase